jgi:hypothetical protein
MDVFTFLWMYFAISLSASLFLFFIYAVLRKYSYIIRRSDAAKAIVAATLLAASLTCLWYSISTTLTIFNKWFMTRWLGGFKFPLLATSVHMVGKIASKKTRPKYYLVSETYATVSLNLPAPL